MPQTTIARINVEIESLVRPLQPAELQLADGPTHALSAHLTITHGAQFTIHTTTGTGALPAGVDAVGGWPAAQQAAKQRKSAAQAGARALMEDWAERSIADFSRTITPADCMQPVRPVGAESTCIACDGAGKLTCSSCDGAKQVTCGECDGRRRVKCSKCGGSQYVSCPACRGRSYIEKQVATEATIYDHQQARSRNGNILQVPCSSCSGTGRKFCTSCTTGTVQCTHCDGRGKVTCATCDGCGTVDCNDCRATGRLHQVATIRCEVQRAHQLRVDDGDREDQQTLQALSLEQLATLTAPINTIALQDWDSDATGLTAHYTANVPRQIVRATANGNEFAVHAYGSGDTVFDYHALGDALLTQDLAGLESHAGGLGLRGAGFHSSLKTFLASEVNVQLAEEAESSGRGTGPLQIGRQKHFVSDDYVQRAAAVFRRSASHLGRGLLMPPVLWTSGAALLLFVLARCGVVHVYWTLRLVAIFGFSIVLWAVLEWRARRGLRSLLGAALTARLNVFAGQRARNYRLLCIAGVLLAWYLSLLGYRVAMHWMHDWPFTFAAIDNLRYWR